MPTHTTYTTHPFFLLIHTGKELGIFKALQAQGPTTSTDLAASLKLSPRYMYEWCLQLAANEFLVYDADTDTFALPPEHAIILCEDTGLMGIVGALSSGISYQYPMLKLAFETNGGIFWGDMKGMMQGARSFFKPVYEMLLPGWIDLDPDLKAMLSTKGAKIADVGCGAGISTREMAKLFPEASLLGIDYHQESIETAQADFAENNIQNANAKTIDSHNWVTQEEEGHYCAITMFDCFHDMADPEGVAAECYKALKLGGKVFMIEPMSSHGDASKDRLTVPGVSVYQGFNLCYCTPCGMSVPGKEGLGTTAGTERYEKIFEGAGYSSFQQVGMDQTGPMAPATNGFRLFVATK